MKPAKADFQLLLYRAVVTTVVTSILCMGVTLLGRSPDSLGSDSLAVMSLCVWSAKDFLGHLLDSRPWHESENVIFGTWGILISLD